MDFNFNQGNEDEDSDFDFEDVFEIKQEIILIVDFKSIVF